MSRLLDEHDDLYIQQLQKQDAAVAVLSQGAAHFVWVNSCYVT